MMRLSSIHQAAVRPLKDYGNLMRDDAEYADVAAKISALACDVTELLDRVEMGQSVAPARIVCCLSFGLFHAAWSENY